MSSSPKISAVRPGSSLLYTWWVVRLACCVWTGLLACSPAPSKTELTGEPASILRGSGQRLALLVAISRYPQSTAPGIKPWRPLHAHRDVIELRSVLSRRYGFADKDIVTLEDEAATAAGIRTAFRRHLVEQAKPGAIVVFHFSGHGQQVRDEDGDEFDGLDETLVPADAIDQRASSGAHVNLRDDEIGDWLRALQARMRDGSGRVQGSINVFLDTCHSGTATRGDLVERGRGWDELLDGPRPAAAENGGEISQALLDQAGEYVLLSAARSDQTAKESRGMGAFSRALVGALWRASSRTTYRELRDEIVAQVQASAWNQSPQLEGTADQLLFGGAAPPPRPYFRVELTRGGELTMAAGELQLVTEGSIYTLHRVGIEAPDETTVIGQAEVVRVMPERSMLRLISDSIGRIPTEPALQGARAVERVRSYKGRQLRVLIADQAIAPTLQAAVLQLPLVTEQGVNIDSYDIKLTQVNGHLELRRPASGCPIARVLLGGRSDAEVAQELGALLEGEWRWRQLYGLRHAESSVRATLKLVPVRAQIGADGHIQGEPTPRTDLVASAELRLNEGDLFTLELYNPTPHPLWVSVLGLDPRGEIQILFPRSGYPGDGLIRPGTVRVSSRYVFQMERPFGMSLYKVIATREPVDFSGLVQRAVELGRGTPSSAERGLRLSELTIHSLRLPPEVSPLVQLLTYAAAGSQRTSNVGLLLSGWGITEVRAELVASRTANGHENVCAQ